MAVRDGRGRIIGSVLVGIVTALMIVAATIDAYAASAEDVRKSVIYLEGGLEMGDAWVVSGTSTAFVVGKQGESTRYLVTDGSLMGVYEQYGSGGMRSLGSGSDALTGRAMLRAYLDDIRSVAAYPVEYDRQSSLLLLRVDDSLEDWPALSLLASDGLDSLQDSEISVIGFDGWLDGLADHGATIRKPSDAMIVDGIVSKVDVDPSLGIKRVWTDAAVRSGNTGGPVVNEAGSVVGVNTWVHEGEKSLNYSIGIGSVTDLLTRNGVTFNTTGDTTDQTEDEETDAAEDEDAGTAEGSTSSVWMGILIAVGLAMVVVASIVVWRILVERRPR